MDSSPPPSPSTSTSRNSSPANDTIHVAASSFIHAPLATLLEYSGVFAPHAHRLATSSITRRSSHEVSIRIMGAGADVGHARQDHARGSDSLTTECSSNASDAPATSGVAVVADVGGEAESGTNGRYDIQQVMRWMEQIIPFSLLLMIVFVRQHLQGFCVIIWITAVLFKSNDIVRKQTALKGERRLHGLMGLSSLFALHVFSIYWWYQREDLLHPLVLLPPTMTPPFWHAVFVIIVNDAMVRQAAIVFKCLLLMYHKNSQGRDYRKQGQMLTLVEYVLLLYRSLLPTPVWYRFFLNKEYGSLFSSLITGLYLTFKLTSVLPKVQLCFSALRALSHKEVHYGSYATSEQVNATGDICAICQEKMSAPILLRCKHIFCEDCVSEWFERERTCPLCRDLVKPADIRSYSDGSTTLIFQLF